MYILKPLKKAALYILIGALLAIPNMHALEAAVCSSDFWVPADLRKYIGVAYPESNAQYWKLSFNTSEDRQMMITLTARFPYARYMAYTLYSLDDNGSKGNPISYGDKVQHIEDEKIQPLIDADDTQHENPYLDDAERTAIINRSYKLYIVQEGSKRIMRDGTVLENTLVVPKHVKKASLFLRVYVPDNKNDAQGGVSLPEIFVSEEGKDDYVACPAIKDMGVTSDDIFDSKRYAEDRILLDDDAIYTFLAGDYGLFPNGDCPYLTTPLRRPRDNDGKYAVLRFKAPKFPDTRNGDIFTEQDEVRYWSICIGDWETTVSGQCLADEDIKPDQDGVVRLLVGPDRLVRGRPGWTNIRWGLLAKPILLFRQISPRDHFAGSFMNAIPAYDQTSGTIDLKNIVTKESDKIAAKEIGEYAPVGKYCSENEFNTNRCGL